ncbi:MAG: hypothetical protein UT64_C0032G0012 [Candidatus Falkowbacteria bacterium GW2011_GWF2_39_8]|uniref:Uncharacterized protein n=1 Tax=Candidatus Falkowbacteria bacterium GW2011_GWF2_39_8 TaxID=1618642 RepID=A0A0G0PX54_9BACT|nr:MAG: hypothetical protein UT64_C0032G0012 [Candidatus Falkowbacteria bacterium GW2011_GWF2_39_8]
MKTTGDILFVSFFILLNMVKLSHDLAIGYNRFIFFKCRRLRCRQVFVVKKVPLFHYLCILRGCLEHSQLCDFDLRALHAKLEMAVD